MVKQSNSREIGLKGVDDSVDSELKGCVDEVFCCHHEMLQ